jgi:hypothetical protein
VDLRTTTVFKRLATAAKPNGSTYAAPFGKVYVSDTLGKQWRSLMSTKMRS